MLPMKTIRPWKFRELQGRLTFQILRQAYRTASFNIL